MLCPTCPSSVLVISERSGIEIDSCPQCRGVWLDRGELDKLIERSLESVQPSAAYLRDGPYTSRDDKRRPVESRKRKSWLNDIFD